MRIYCFLLSFLTVNEQSLDFGLISFGQPKLEKLWTKQLIVKSVNYLLLRIVINCRQGLRCSVYAGFLPISHVVVWQMKISMANLRQELCQINKFRAKKVDRIGKYSAPFVKAVITTDNRSE